MKRAATAAVDVGARDLTVSFHEQDLDAQCEAASHSLNSFASHAIIRRERLTLAHRIGRLIGWPFSHGGRYA